MTTVNMKSADGPEAPPTGMRGTQVVDLGRRLAKAIATTLTSAALAGCMTAPTRANHNPVSSAVCVNGIIVSSGDLMLRDLLDSRVSTRRWLKETNQIARGPLVLVDAIEVDGLGRLATIPAASVTSVETLDAQHAVSEFGLRGRDGAVLVFTTGADPRVLEPGMRPPDRCRI
jgi:hypothetical protein